MPEPAVNGLRPQITEEQDAGPEKFTLTCPRCGVVGRYRFALLARRAFEAHADEEHPAVDSPLDRIRTLVDLAETTPGAWGCELGQETYVVRQRAHDQYEVEVTSRRITIDAPLRTLDDARIAIGGHAKLVNAALATAATIQLRHGTPADAIPLE
ncbi:hypothetical protein ACFY1P_34065 [Streptomyces sp. NPDC001407]|uniref:hypothetical protein n=1 Tax=Streptomyces sp. NPDC001407 TaxID=3364573 RepID=UPI00369B5723